jgi:hypothetical protein
MGFEGSVVMPLASYLVPKGVVAEAETLGLKPDSAVSKWSGI